MNPSCEICRRSGNDSRNGTRLTNIMNKLNVVVERFGMRINKSKTKIMKIGRGVPEQLHIKIDDTELEQVHQIKYLGSLVTEDGWSEKEVRTGIAMAKDAFNKDKKIPTGNKNIQLKKRLIN